MLLILISMSVLFLVTFMHEKKLNKMIEAETDADVIAGYEKKLKTIRLSRKIYAFFAVAIVIFLILLYSGVLF